MRRFYLKRTSDETGISGTGRVLNGVLFASGKVVVEWAGEFASVTLHQSMESFKAVHMSPHHPTANALVWLDDRDHACKCGHPLWWHLSGGDDGYLEYCEGSVNGLCACAEFTAPKFADDVPPAVGYFGANVTVPTPDTLLFALEKAGLVGKN